MNDSNEKARGGVFRTLAFLMDIKFVALTKFIENNIVKYNIMKIKIYKLRRFTDENHSNRKNIEKKVVDEP